MILTRVVALSRWILLLLMCWLLGAGFAAASGQPDAAQLAKAVEAVEYLDQMRQALASGLLESTEPVTGETFKQVCRPVGMQAQTLAQENGWQVKQIAQKYRNPKHAPDNLHAKIALARFQQDPDLIGFWDHEILNGQPGIRYYRRINVEASCLTCHGAKESRPEFVVSQYPQDLAYDFKVGDLRGMYAVFIPDQVAASSEPNP